MTTYCIESPLFNICLQFNIFESDIKLSSNTLLTVSIKSDGFCANTDMDIDIKQFIIFIDNLEKLYSTLKGRAVIEEPYGEKQFIEFNVDQTGHIRVRGKLSSNGRNGFSQELVFENCIDQTYLSEFVRELSMLCNKYR